MQPPLHTRVIAEPYATTLELTGHSIELVAKLYACYKDYNSADAEDDVKTL
jgi:hypothetical protein